MSAALLAALLLGPAPGQGVDARFAVQPAEVEVGEPLELSLEVQHPSEESLFDLELAELALDPSWVLFDSRRHLARALDGAPGRSVTRWTWTIASLEPGRRSLREALTGLVADPRVERIDLAGLDVSVGSVLAAEEDAPRPLRGPPAGFLRADADTREGGLPDWATAGLSAAFAATLVVLWTRRRRACTPSTPAPEPLEELERLRAGSERSPEALRAVHYELTRLVRDAADRRQRRERGGLTDEEWIARTRGELPAGLASELEELLARCGEVKYGGHTPTEWALEETCGRTRRALQALGAADTEAGR